MPKLWTDTIEEHRHQVREAILAATAALVDDQGLLSVTMSAIAERSGIGRATLYKYFPDVEAILLAWHERKIGGHLEELARLAHRPGTPGDRATAALEAYALMRHNSRGQHDTDLGAFLHRGPHLAGAERALHGLIHHLLDEAAHAGEVRDDVPAAELATYCLHALDAAASAASAAAVHRLVTLTWAALQPPR